MVTGRRLASDVPTSRVAHQATNVASTPPTSDSAKPSVSSWRTTRRRLPPSASRIANSLRRELPRASSMLARFSDATRRTRPDIEKSRIARTPSSLSVCGLVLTDMRASGAMRERLILVLAGERPLERDARRVESRRDRRNRRARMQTRDQDQRVVPAVGHRRRQPVADEVVRDRVVNAGRHPEIGETSTIDPPNPRGATPITVNCRPLRRIWIRRGRCGRPFAATRRNSGSSTGMSAPGRSSSAENVRP